MVKFSILIANYNNGHYFEECWQSILSQTNSNWEVIIVDDCSTDNSVELIQKIISGDERCQFFQNKTNKGCGYTKRKCAEMAGGDFFAFLDPDDTIASNALAVMQVSFNENPQVGLVSSRLSICDENLNKIRDKKIQDVVDYNDLKFFNFGGKISAFASFKREVYRQTEGIDPYMLRAVDQDLYLKLCEKTNVLTIDNLLYNYRIHAEGISTGGSDNENVSKAVYWHWYAINAAAKRRGIYVEDLFTESFSTRAQFNLLKQKINLIENSGSYKLAKRIARFKNIFSRNRKAK